MCTQARGFGWDSGSQHAEASFTADGTQTEEGVWPEASSDGRLVISTGAASLGAATQQHTAQQQGSEAGILSSAATGALLEPEAHIADALVHQRMPDGETAVEPMHGSREAEPVVTWSAASDTTAHAHNPAAALASTQAAPADYAPVNYVEDQNNTVVLVEPADHARVQQSSAASGRLQDRSFFMEADRGHEGAEVMQPGLAAYTGGSGHGRNAAPTGQTAADRGDDERANNATG